MDLNSFQNLEKSEELRQTHYIDEPTHNWVGIDSRRKAIVGLVRAQLELNPNSSFLSLSLYFSQHILLKLLEVLQWLTKKLTDISLQYS